MYTLLGITDQMCTYCRPGEQPELEGSCGPSSLTVFLVQAQFSRCVDQKIVSLLYQAVPESSARYDMSTGYGNRSAEDQTVWSGPQSYEGDGEKGISNPSMSSMVLG